MLSMIIASNAHAQLIWEFCIIFFGSLASIGIIWFICAASVEWWQDHQAQKEYKRYRAQQKNRQIKRQKLPSNKNAHAINAWRKKT